MPAKAKSFSAWSNRLESIQPDTEIKIRRLFTSLSVSEINNLVEKQALTKIWPPNFSGIMLLTATELMRALLQNLWQIKYWTGLYHKWLTPPQLWIMTIRFCIHFRDISPAPVELMQNMQENERRQRGRECKFIDIEQGWADHESLKVDTLPCTVLTTRFMIVCCRVGIAMMNKMRRGSGITPKQGLCYITVETQWLSQQCWCDHGCSWSGELWWHNFVASTGSWFIPGKRLWPVEVHTANFDVIRLGTALGVIIIEAAANGSIYFNLSSDLDQFVLNGKRIFNRWDPDFRDSGAIMVAGASARVPHARIFNSNYGSRIDCYAWGESVYTAGNFPNSSNGAVDRYTNEFCGTSSAAAIIAGVGILYRV